MLGAVRERLRGVAPKVNIALDLSLLAVASFAATRDGRLLTPLGAATFAGATALWLFGCRVLGHYTPWKPQGPAGDLVTTALLVVGVAAGLALGRAVALEHAHALRVGAFLAMLLPSVLAVRLALRLAAVIANARPSEVLVVGAGPLGRHTGLDFGGAWSRRRLLGYLSWPDEPHEPRLPAPVLGSATEIAHVLAEHAVDEVYVAGNVRRHADEMQAVVRECERFGIPFALPAAYLRLDRARPESRIDDGYVHFVSVEPKRVQHAVKRLVDIAVTVTALAILSPLLVAVAVAIKTTSRGPLFFKQLRVGQRGRPFYMLKFRSMVADAERLKDTLLAQNEQSGPVFKIKRDPRVTTVGRFIRAHSIDELPQLVNVLRGEMTLVGPRPPLPDEVAKYEPWQRRRLSVRPGLTCHWQVSGRNELSFERWMYLDMQYIDHWSLGEDLRLILRTFPVVLSGRGAS